MRRLLQRTRSYSNGNASILGTILETILNLQQIK